MPTAGRSPSPPSPATRTLNALAREKEITLELQSYNQAGVFKSYDKINYLYLVMPVRI